MSDWREGFKKALIDYMLREGSAVRKGPGRSFYSSWHDFSAGSELREHLGTCSIDYAKCRTDEGEWEEFDGTFANPPWGTHHGLDGWITCTCGTVEGVHIRIERSFSDLMQGLLREPDAEEE